MNKNKHLLLWSSLGVLVLLMVAAVQENFLKTWRQIQSTARTDAGSIDVHLRQIVVPKTGAVDRCVSCHVGMAPGEQNVEGPQVVQAHRNVVHDPTEFGCTVCHGGQGRATDPEDAHGRVHFWPQPMIPTQFAYAGCGSCHSHLQVPNESVLRDGLAVIERLDCLACHRLDGRGATIRPGGAGGMEGPDLSLVGAKGYDLNWYARHEAQYAATQDGPWRVSFGPIDLADRRLIEDYLASRVGAPELVEAKALFHSLGCRGCHKVNGVGGDDGPDLTVVGDRDPALLNFTHVPGERTFANWLAEHFRAPARVVPDSKMPVLGLTEEQIRKLVMYMLSLRRGDVPETMLATDRLRAERMGEREFAADGATLFGTFCAACHGVTGEGRWYPGASPFPAIGSPDFLAVATDEFLARTVREGRPGRRMPAWGATQGGLRPAEIEAIIAHLRQRSGAAAPQDSHAERRWVAASSAPRGKELFGRYCAGCHGAQGEGLQAPALNHPNLLAAATDSYLVETIGRGRRGTPMQGFRGASPVHPALAEDELESLVAFLRTWETEPSRSE